MKPLIKGWNDRYREMDKDKALTALNGYEWKKNWIGAWRLMLDFQNTSVCEYE